MDGDIEEATDVPDATPDPIEEAPVPQNNWTKIRQVVRPQDDTPVDQRGETLRLIASVAHDEEKAKRPVDPERDRLNKVRLDTQLHLLVEDTHAQMFGTPRPGSDKESLVGSQPLTEDSQESGIRRRVTIRSSVADSEFDLPVETEPVDVDQCAICRHLFDNYAKEDELESHSNADPRNFRAPFAQFWREKEMLEDTEAPQSRPALCSFHTLYKERHDFLVYILEQRRQGRRLAPAELSAMQNIEKSGKHDASYLRDVEVIVKEHFKIAREAVMRRLATEARQLRSHWESTKDQQDQEIVNSLGDMQKRHQSAIQEQRQNIRAALGRKKLHYSSEMLSSFENEKHLLAKREWDKARNETLRATQVEKQARRQFQIGIEEEAKRREDWVRTLLERQKNSRIERCTRRRQMGAVERASDGDKLYRRLEQTTQRLNKAHAVEMRKLQVHFSEHCSRLSHIVERTARGTGAPQEADHRQPLYVKPVRVPFRAEEPGSESKERPKSAGAKVTMARSLPGEFASKILAEEMRISMHRKLAATSRMRRTGSAPGPGGDAAKITVSAARPPSANSRLRNPVEQKMAEHLRKRPSSASALGRQSWSQETSGKGIYGTQWPQPREVSQCDFCGKRTGKPKLLPGSNPQDDNEILCVGCSWECVRQWNAKLSPPFLRDDRADLIQDLCGKEALAAAEAEADM
jgi:hypothetical protein